MRIVIAGALGHIGSRAMRDLPGLVGDLELVLVDNLSTQRYASLFGLPPTTRYTFLEADILDLDLPPVLQGADAVINLAAITNAEASVQNREEVERVNFNVTSRLAHACLETGCPLIHLSSTSVYGTQEERVDESCSAADLKPQSPYAETKLREEALLQTLGRDRGLSFLTFRFGTICGVSPGMRFHTAVNRFCWQAVLGQPLTVWRTALHQRRPYLALDDAVRALAFVLGRRLFDRRIYNVLTANLTVHDIVESIRRRVPDLTLQYVDSAIMNQLSYEVGCERFRDQGFAGTGSIAASIDATSDLLSSLGGSRVR